LEEEENQNQPEPGPERRVKKTPRQIRERRMKIQLLQSRGMNQIQIAQELGVKTRNNHEGHGVHQRDVKTWIV
jgi:DNA-binding NarL/FixJ family response regulator